MDKKKLTGNLKITEVDILANSTFVCHGHIQHHCSGWDGGLGLPYNTFVREQRTDLRYAVSSACLVSLCKDSWLSDTDERKAYPNVKNEFTNDGSNRSS